MTMWTIIQAALLVLNAFAILNEDRFLIPCEFAPHEPLIAEGRHKRGAPIHIHHEHVPTREYTFRS